MRSEAPPEDDVEVERVEHRGERRPEGRAIIEAAYRFGVGLGVGVARLDASQQPQVAGKKVMPWRIEDAARERGANYVQGGVWKAFAVRDGRLITGQQQYSGGKVAELVIEAVGT